MFIAVIVSEKGTKIERCNEERCNKERCNKERCNKERCKARIAERTIFVFELVLKVVHNVFGFLQLSFYKGAGNDQQSSHIAFLTLSSQNGHYYHEKDFLPSLK